MVHRSVVIYNGLCDIYHIILTTFAVVGKLRRFPIDQWPLNGWDWLYCNDSRQRVEDLLLAFSSCLWQGWLVLDYWELYVALSTLVVVQGTCGEVQSDRNRQRDEVLLPWRHEGSQYRSQNENSRHHIPYWREDGRCVATFIATLYK